LQAGKLSRNQKTRISLGSCLSLSIDPHPHDDSTASKTLICSTDPVIQSFPNSRWFLPLKGGDTCSDIVYGLVDSGSSRSFIGSVGLSLVRYWKIKYEDIQKITVIVANGNSEMVSRKLIVIAYLEGRQVELTMFYLPSLAAPVLLGIDLCIVCSYA